METQKVYNALEEELQEIANYLVESCKEKKFESGNLLEIHDDVFKETAWIDLLELLGVDVVTVLYEEPHVGTYVVFFSHNLDDILWKYYYPNY